MSKLTCRSETDGPDHSFIRSIDFTNPFSPFAYCSSPALSVKSYLDSSPVPSDFKQAAMHLLGTSPSESSLFSKELAMSFPPCSPSTRNLHDHKFQSLPFQESSRISSLQSINPNLELIKRPLSSSGPSFIKTASSVEPSMQDSVWKHASQAVYLSRDTFKPSSVPTRFNSKVEPVNFHAKKNSDGDLQYFGSYYKQRVSTFPHTPHREIKYEQTPSFLAEAHDTQASKQNFKDFLKKLKDLEKEGFLPAVKYACEEVTKISPKYHWKVFLELADFAKRMNKSGLARKLYMLVIGLQPQMPQPWLEFAKMEEESGNLESCMEIISLGLQKCPMNESLLVKGIRNLERLGKLEEARVILSKMKSVPLEKTWKALLEGALMEQRQGNYIVARKIFKYLMAHLPGYGAIHLEAYKNEEKINSIPRAIGIVEKGLTDNPKYGPLWFALLRLHEKIGLYDPNFSPNSRIQPYVEVSCHVCANKEKEIVQLTGKEPEFWQIEDIVLTNNEARQLNVHYQYFKNFNLVKVREVVKDAAESISKELLWKIYFEAAAIEERYGNVDLSRKYLVNAVHHCLPTLVWKIWLAGSRLELSIGNIGVARKLIARALTEVPSKMKSVVLLEFSRLEELIGNTENATKILEKAKKEAKHEWKVFLEAILLQLRENNIPQAIAEAQEALKIHQGTGRLWAILIQLMVVEGPEQQWSTFKTALKEVPKSGEVWCEGARICIRDNRYDEARKFLEFAINFTPQYGDSFIELLLLEILEHGADADLSEIIQLCMNADPNYGALWVYCKRHPLDLPSQVLLRARQYILEELAYYSSTSNCNVPKAKLNQAILGDNMGKRFSLLSVNSLFTNLKDICKAERLRIIFGSDPLKP